MALKVPRARADVFEPSHFPLIVAKLRESQVEAPVAVQVGGAHIDDPGGILEDGVGGEVLSAVVFEDKGSANAIIVGKYHRHTENEQIQVAVLIHVGRLDVNRTAHVGSEQRFGSKLAGGCLANPADLIGRGFAENHVIEPILIEIDRTDVGDPRLQFVQRAQFLRLEQSGGFERRGG
ncbi:MAG: hypothetical protein J6386_15100 [Candidatus Synoicihabitans palmerolidicus]|nr:hypothetical protein [Candidatus Synoicihabitans palmerolidicus]